MTDAHDLFPGFASHRLAGDGVEIFARVGGSGPPLICLHGHPESHAMFHAVAPALARHFTVVAADLRGYGESGVPAFDAAHLAMSKRAMAADMVSAMRHLGFDRFAVLGHDRGARVAYRLALDHPERVTRLTVLDVIPTLDIWETLDVNRTMRLWHWPVLAQPAPLPERMLAATPDWVDVRLKRRGDGDLPPWADPRAVEIFKRAFRDPTRQKAICECYRAGATCDIDHDRADREGGRKIRAPLQVLWGTRGSLGDGPDAIATWRKWCDDVVGAEIDSGHFIPEEKPDEMLAHALPFLTANEAAR